MDTIRRPEDARTAQRVDVREALPRSGVDDVGVGGIDHERRDGEVGHEVIDGLPALAGVVGAPHAAPHAAGPHRLGLLGVHDDRPRPTTDIARSDRAPARGTGAEPRERREQAARRDVASGGHPRHLVTRRRTRAAAVELAQGVGQRVGRDATAIGDRLAHPERLPRARQVRILEAAHGAPQRRVRDLQQGRRRQPPGASQIVEHCFGQATRLCDLLVGGLVGHRVSLLYCLSLGAADMPRSRSASSHSNAFEVSSRARSARVRTDSLRSSTR